MRIARSPSLSSIAACASALLLALLLGACARTPPPLEQQAYVWQRVWTPAVIHAVQGAAADFSGLRVLAAQMRADGGVDTFDAGLATLAQTRLPVIAVLRIDGQLTPGDAAALWPALQALIQRWRAAGVALAGIEIDHDCATARLPAYAVLLGDLRAHLPRELRLSITALPAWLQSAALPAVLAAADEAVLQVHAVENPQRGLFARTQAAAWISAFAARAGKPFRVALPAYATRVDWDDSGRIVAVTSEAPGLREGAIQRELSADPREVAALLQALRRDPPPQLAGVVWFRLPSSEDQRAWRAETLHAVIAGLPLQADVRAVLAPRDSAGLYDLRLENRGNLDADAPGAVAVQAGDCRADALAGYALADADADTARATRWKLQTPTRLGAGQRRIIGWLRCAQSLPENVIHVEP